MTVTMSVNTTGNLRVGRNSSADPYYERRVRSFVKFDISGGGYAIEDIQTAQLKLICVTVAGAADLTVRLKTGSATNNWGATLLATLADFESTDAYDEEDVEVHATGTYYWTIDKEHLNLSGLTYFRLQCTEESTLNQSYVDFYSQNNATAANRPKLVITLTPSEVVVELDALGVTANLPALTIVPEGFATVILDALGLAATIPVLAVVPEGVATVALDPLGVAATAPVIGVVTQEVVRLDALSIVASVGTLRVIGGVIVLRPEGELTVHYEDRLETVSAEDRMHVVESEDRMHVVPEEDRIEHIEPEDRTPTVH
jgi:hypothetical protein